MKYYNFRITNLDFGWFRWKPKYLKNKRQKAEPIYFYLIGG